MAGDLNRAERLNRSGKPRRLRSALGVRLAGAALCTAGLAFIGFGTVGSPWFFGPAALTANKGDVWVNNVGDDPTAGHENDPHLICLDINVMGDALANSTGTFTVVGQPPSGTGSDQAYPTSGTATWNYDKTTGGNQVIATIPVATLIANAVANGDTAQPQQGYHFKLLFVQDPSKFKVFWVDCDAQTTTATTTVTSTRPGTTTTKTTTEPGTTTTTTAPGTTDTKTVTVSTATTVTSPTTQTNTITTTTTAPGTTDTVTTTVPTTSTEITTVTSNHTATTTETVPTTVTEGTTVTSSATATTTKTVTTGSAGSPTSSTSSTSSSTPTSGVAAATTTPSTGSGSDIAFGTGLVLLVAGGGLIAGATRITRRKKS